MSALENSLSVMLCRNIELYTVVCLCLRFLLYLLSIFMLAIPYRYHSCIHIILLFFVWIRISLAIYYENGKIWSWTVLPTNELWNYTINKIIDTIFNCKKQLTKEKGYGSLFAVFIYLYRERKKLYNISTHSFLLVFKTIYLNHKNESNNFQFDLTKPTQ